MSRAMFCRSASEGVRVVIPPSHGVQPTQQSLEYGAVKRDPYFMPLLESLKIRVVAFHPLQTPYNLLLEYLYKTG